MCVVLRPQGVNAQMAVPTNVLSHFRQACETLPLFRGLYLNTDHVMTKSEFEVDKVLHEPLEEVRRP